MLNITAQRQHSQRLTGMPFNTPEDAVRWFGAVQAQDYPAARWALGGRCAHSTDAAIEEAANAGRILRTHVLRPTWHFVLPEDIGWMLKLTAQRVKAQLQFGNRQAGLDEDVFPRSSAALEKAMVGGRQLTRAQVTSILEGIGITMNTPITFTHVLMRAELDGVVCSGAWQGKQPTYALLAERAPNARTLTRDESLAELARRYFVGHGPATLKDYVWWSGLTTTDARAGLETVKAGLMSETVGGETVWFADTAPIPPLPSPTVHLLSNYDEYVVGYTDRSAIWDDAHAHKLDARGNVLFNHTILIDGRIAGLWKRTVKKKAVEISLTHFRDFTPAEEAALAAEMDRFGAYLGLPVMSSS